MSFKVLQDVFFHLPSFFVGYFFSIYRLADNHGLVILVEIPGPGR